MSGKNVTEVVLADAHGIAKAAKILESGGLVAVPTETVYGLAARADSADAVAKIYAAKGRPDFNPLIVHVSDLEQAKRIGRVEGVCEKIAEEEWPGPLTLVVPLTDNAKIAAAVTAGLPTVALRSPHHPAMHALLKQVDFPLAAPSANRSGFISPTSAEHVMGSLAGRIDLVLDGGATKAGLESTILVVREDGSWQVLRPGPISQEDIADRYFAGLVASEQAGELLVEAPGQLTSHYSPGKPIRLNTTEAAPDDFVIGFGAIGGDCSLSECGDLSQAAARLYDCLHQAARSEKSQIAVAPIPGEGIGRAINDRLRRAAA
ncbi:MAG: L-threonylcarbamoyladenylate synthase [Pseudomonadota bacterium]